MTDRSFRQLTPDEIRELIAFIYKKGVKRPCPECGRIEVGAGAVYLEGGYNEAGDERYYPLGVLTCEYCGATRFFNLIVAGIHKPGSARE